MTKRFIVLCGGVGGSRLAEGLSQHLPPEALTIIVNTGDDFDHLGLRICPDIDTVLYMLAHCVSRERGWGREDESWVVHETLSQLGGPNWFQLGDRDIALHLTRNFLLSQGKGLTETTRHIANALGVSHVPVPVTEVPVPTFVRTRDGDLAFQDYFVRRRAEVSVLGLTYAGTHETPITAEVEAAFEDSNLAGIIIAPSNPFLSIGPMLAIGDLRQRLASRKVPALAVSPYLHGQAVKGPVGRLQADLGFRAGDEGVLDYYSGLVDILFVCGTSAHNADGVSVEECETLMADEEGRGRLGRRVLERLGWRG
jgi:LPPG:FO 2-phospho-L-lactate transferase